MCRAWRSPVSRIDHRSPLPGPATRPRRRRSAPPGPLPTSAPPASSRHAATPPPSALDLGPRSPAASAWGSVRRFGLAPGCASAFSTAPMRPGPADAVSVDERRDDQQYRTQLVRPARPVPQAGRDQSPLGRDRPLRCSLQGRSARHHPVRDDARDRPVRPHPTTDPLVKPTSGAGNERGGTTGPTLSTCPVSPTTFAPSA